MSKIRALKVSPKVSIDDAQAERIAAELTVLAGGGSYRSVPTRTIVEAARDPSSAMHSVVWAESDESCAYKYRLEIASTLVCSIHIEHDDGERERFMISVSHEDGIGDRAYVPTQDVRASEFMTKQVEQRSIQRLNAWLNEFRAFRNATMIAPLWDKIRAELRSLGVLDDQESRAAALRPASRRTAAQRTSASRAAPHRSRKNQK